MGEDVPARLPEAPPDDQDPQSCAGPRLHRHRQPPGPGEAPPVPLRGRQAQPRDGRPGQGEHPLLDLQDLLPPPGRLGHPRPLPPPRPRLRQDPAPDGGGLLEHQAPSGRRDQVLPRRARPGGEDGLRGVVQIFAGRDHGLHLRLRDGDGQEGHKDRRPLHDPGQRRAVPPGDGPRREGRQGKPGRGDHRPFGGPKLADGEGSEAQSAPRGADPAEELPQGGDAEAPRTPRGGPLLRLRRLRRRRQGAPLRGGDDHADGEAAASEVRHQQARRVPLRGLPPGGEGVVHRGGEALPRLVVRERPDLDKDDDGAGAAEDRVPQEEPPPPRPGAGQAP